MLVNYSFIPNDQGEPEKKWDEAIHKLSQESNRGGIIILSAPMYFECQNKPIAYS